MITFRIHIGEVVEEWGMFQNEAVLIREGDDDGFTTDEALDSDFEDETEDLVVYRLNVYRSRELSFDEIVNQAIEDSYWDNLGNIAPAA